MRARTCTTDQLFGGLDTRSVLRPGGICNSFSRNSGCSDTMGQGYHLQGSGGQVPARFGDKLLGAVTGGAGRVISRGRRTWTRRWASVWIDAAACFCPNDPPDLAEPVENLVDRVAHSSRRGCPSGNCCEQRCHHHQHAYRPSLHVVTSSPNSGVLDASPSPPRALQTSMTPFTAKR